MVKCKEVVMFNQKGEKHTLRIDMSFSRLYFDRPITQISITIKTKMEEGGKGERGKGKGERGKDERRNTERSCWTISWKFPFVVAYSLTIFLSFAMAQ